MWKLGERVVMRYIFWDIMDWYYCSLKNNNNCYADDVNKTLSTIIDDFQLEQLNKIIESQYDDYNFILWTIKLPFNETHINKLEEFLNAQKGRYRVNDAQIIWLLGDAEYDSSIPVKTIDKNYLEIIFELKPIIINYHKCDGNIIIEALPPLGKTKNKNILYAIGKHFAHQNLYIFDENKIISLDNKFRLVSYTKTFNYIKN